MWLCGIWQQDLALCLTEAHRYLVEVYSEWSTVNYLATHHKGNCSRLRSCLSQTPSQQPPEHFCLVTIMHQRIFASPNTLPHPTNCYTVFVCFPSLVFLSPQAITLCYFIQLFKCLSFGKTLMLCGVVEQTDQP